MRRIEWLSWAARYGNPKTRSRNIASFLAFELYWVGCKLSGYHIAHWLDDAPSMPAGKYLRVTRSAPLTVRLLDKIFPFGEETHSDYVPFTPEAEEEMQREGMQARIVEISYRLSGSSSA